MSNLAKINPETPSFIYGYWRPWKENSNIIDSFLDYSKDVSLAKYGADTVGKYIAQASSEQVGAINQLGQQIGAGLNVLSNQMGDISSELNFLNRNIGIQIEQQKLSNLLLQNISELLRVPDREKERQHAIELGIKFFVNAQKDVDLFDDSLEELLKAESLMKQDYFVLHRLGLIYMHAPKHINVEKALDYFTKAAKYASVESDPDAMRLVNALSDNFNNVKSPGTKNINEIEHLAAESYEKAAFASYVLGQFELAVTYQSKALKYKKTAENYFMLAKFQTRIKDINSCVSNLEIAIDNQPSMALAVFREIDLMNEPDILLLIKEKNKIIDDKIIELYEKYEKVKSEKSFEVISKLNELKHKSYDFKVSEFKKYTLLEVDLDNNIEKEKKKIDDIIDLIYRTQYIIPKTEFDSTIESLRRAKEASLEKIQSVLKEAIAFHKKNIIRIGSKYAGGIVFYLDKTGEHGLIAAEKDLDEAIWGSFGKLETKTTIGSGMSNTKLILEKASWSKGFFSSKKTPTITAARLCLESNINGYNDWFLPSKEEAFEMYLRKDIIGEFSIGYYWTSSDKESHVLEGESAWKQGFSNTDYFYGFKDIKYNVRAIRSF